MNTSLTTELSKPVGDERVPPDTLWYFRGRHRYRVYDFVLSELRRIGLTQTSLAKRLGLSDSRISKLLSGPGNWTLDTVSDLLFAMGGGEPRYQIIYPLDGATRNYETPEWLDQGRRLWEEQLRAISRRHEPTPPPIIPPGPIQTRPHPGKDPGPTPADQMRLQ
ncbi:MAG: helix-turn-helix transcriptional regulator [Proteobacteria bacterium]|nr:helix-turn-helix transcriptional regulator [Pseudomonadota bacterium]MBI3496215.1 helix-turn-helix transcriptional regulator [Pseudomonadota bacterium]